MVKQTTKNDFAEDETKRGIAQKLVKFEGSVGKKQSSGRSCAMMRSKLK